MEYLVKPDYIGPGRYFTTTYGAGKIGVCFYNFAWKTRRELPGGAPGRQPVGSITKQLICRDVTIVITRDGCDVRARY